MGYFHDMTKMTSIFIVISFGSTGFTYLYCIFLFILRNFRICIVNIYICIVFFIFVV